MVSFTKDEVENWLFGSIDIVEQFIIGYIKTCVGIVFSPKMTLTRLFNEEEKISPIFYFLFNIILVVVDGKTLSDLLNAAIKNVLLTSKPTWDNTFLGLLSYIAGLIVFVIAYHFTENRCFKTKSSIKDICNAFMYASFLFIPIIIINKLIYFIFYYNVSEILSQFINLQDPIILLKLLLLVLVISSVYFIWWSYLVFIALKIRSLYTNIQIVKLLTMTLLFLLMINAFISNFSNLSKMIELIRSVQSKSQMDNALKKIPPDYLKISFILWSTSDKDIFSPYIKYKSSLALVAYMMAYLEHPKAAEGLIYVSNKNYVAIEKLYASDIENAFKLSMTEQQRRYFKMMKDSLDNAKKQKSLPDFGIGDDLVRLSVGLSSNSDFYYIKLLP